MKKPVKIFFTDFWGDFDFEDNIFVNVLKDKYEIEITDRNPDILFYSVFGWEFRKYNCLRVFFTGENIRPKMDQCDFSFSFDDPRGDSRIYRLPQYFQYGDMDKLTEKPDIERIISEKTKFCNFVFSNPNCKKRNLFFDKLSKYKKVDSAGRFRNNIGRLLGFGPAKKREFIRDYKFTIAFENEEAEYYTTEKIFEAMYVDSIPLYWGNPLVEMDFNPKSFINWYDYGSDEAMIEKIIEIDSDDTKYAELLAQPWFHNNEVNGYVKKENILRQLEHIIEGGHTPIARSLPEGKLKGKARDLVLQKYRMGYKLHRLGIKVRGFNLDKIRREIDTRRLRNKSD